jgi:hypothetical protein
MIVYIGEDILFNGKQYHVQDTNFLTLSAKVGEVDKHGLVWDTFWVDFDDIEKRVMYK